MPILDPATSGGAIEQRARQRANRGVITYYNGALGNHESTRVGSPPPAVTATWSGCVPGGRML